MMQEARDSSVKSVKMYKTARRHNTVTAARILSPIQMDSFTETELRQSWFFIHSVKLLLYTLWNRMGNGGIAPLVHDLRIKWSGQFHTLVFLSLWQEHPVRTE